MILERPGARILTQTDQILHGEIPPALNDPP